MSLFADVLVVLGIAAAVGAGVLYTLLADRMVSDR